MNRKDERYKKDGVRSFGLTLVCLIVLVSLSACSRSAQIVTPPPTSTIRPTQMAATATVAPTATSQPLPDLQPAIDRALDFFNRQYIPRVGLLRESPEAAHDICWLATDNLLATYAYDALGVPDPYDLHAKMAEYGEVHNGLIEALVGDNVSWPPQIEVSTTLTTIVASLDITSPLTIEVRTETRNNPNSTGIFNDWHKYADLALYGALDAHNEGDAALAHDRYTTILDTFDGIGFPDLAYQAGQIDAEGKTQHYYATYKLALALLVGQRIGAPLDHGILDALLDKQDLDTGGFTSLYHAGDGPQGDANTETTSYALLALSELSKE